MTTWTEAEKDKARALAEKHFSGAPAKKAPAKKGTRKKAKKAPAKKVAKKKAAPKKAAKKTSAKAAPKKAAKKQVKKVRRRQAKKSPEKAQPSTVMQRIEQTSLQIDTLGKAIDHMGKVKNLGCPSSVVQEGAKRAQEGLISAVNNLCELTGEASASGLTTAAGGNGSNPVVNKAWNTAVDAAQAGMNAIPQAPPSQVGEVTPE